MPNNPTYRLGANEATNPPQMATEGHEMLSIPNISLVGPI